ncbi:MAG TPA: tRNA glutamyl-Q(34) synthetase GluQRS [Stellaceae bacterium]|nr:tRNA glutamyl-Q(34) synthetase GluQRS [Stellaceae bacterium]
MPLTRFAPSPTGYLHLGHAYSALFAAAAAGPEGTCLLRLEDIDRIRCRADLAAAALEDLAWLGFSWPEPVRRQSDHFDEYRAVLAELDGRGLIYPCFCTRADIAAEAAPHGPNTVYPGICRALSPAQRAAKLAEGGPHALRLDMARAAAETGPLVWHDRALGRVEAMPKRQGDVVLARKDCPTSYHLAVTLDDARQGVELVTRGTDLVEATDIHRLLQALFDLPVPEYHHHPLLTDGEGRRLAKRDGAPSLRRLRAAGQSPAEVRALAGFPD